MKKVMELMLGAFPRELEQEINSIFEKITLKTESYNGGKFDIQINKEIVRIPERIYSEDVGEVEEAALSQIQKQILNCYFTRHHNGYIRQKRVNNIFKSGMIHYWCIPYIIRLAGEYVVEIIDDINRNINLVDEKALRDFIRQNQKFILTTEGRIASYWGEFYRHDYPKDKYVGFNVKQYIQHLRKSL